MIKKLNILLSFHCERRQLLMLMPHFSKHQKQSEAVGFKSLVGVGMGSNSIGICGHILRAYPEANPY